MHGTSHFEQLRHDLRTYLNHITGYSDIIRTDAREYGKVEFIPGLEQIAKKAEKVRKLISFFFDDDTDLLAIATPEDIRKAFYVPLVQIISDARRLLVLFRSQEPIFIRDMEQLLAVANQMLDLVEAEIIDLQLEDLRNRQRPPAPKNPPKEKKPLSIEDIPSFREFEGEVGEDLAGEKARIIGKILIVDDSPASQNLLTRHLSALGHTTIPMNSGEEALEYLQNNTVDIIILDVLMPGMTGYQVLRELKRDEALRDIPVIMISSLDSSESVAQCIKLGAEDYLPKDFEPSILWARIDASLERKRLQEQQEIYLQAIIESQQALAGELSDAAHYISSLLPKPITTPEVETGLTFIPSAQLGGDYAGHYWLDSHTLSLFVLDVSGHGIKSALLSVSLSNALNNRAVPGADFYNPGDLLTKLNQSFQSEAEVNAFFTIWYGVLDVETGHLKYASGGAPPALLIRPPAPVITASPDHPPQNLPEPEIFTLNTQDVLMGADDEHEYQTGSFQMQSQDYLYVFSDGIFEIARPNGRMLGLQEFTRLLPLLRNRAQANLDEVVNQVRALSMSDHFDDDISLLALQVLR